MLQNYPDGHAVLRRQPVLSPARFRLIILTVSALLFSLYLVVLIGRAGYTSLDMPAPASLPMEPMTNDLPPVGARVDSVATVVAKALYFKGLLTTAQQTTLQQTYTTTLARRWSNLPCTNTCRNGIALGSNLNTTQLTAALDVLRAAMGTAANQGFSQFMQIRYADKYLNSIGGGSSYDSSNYYMAFLNTPSTTGAWMLQVGGHHYAMNIAFNGGRVVGATPVHEAVEPVSFTFNNTTYTPMKQEHDSLANMLAGLSTAQLTTAKLSGTFGDCVMLPGESNGGTSTFPAKAGLLANVLTTAQKSLVFAAMRTYTSDLDDSTAAVLQTMFESQIDSTYIGWTGSGTSGSASTFLNANANYVRLDGPRVWIEFACQNGVLIQNQIHYHSVFRDRQNDYGKDLTAVVLPLSLQQFDVVLQGKSRLLSWATANEYKVGYFEVQRSVDPSAGFTTIAKVNAANNSRNTYTYTDAESVKENVVYYRLNMVDADGRATLSHVVAVRYSTGATGLTIYPNPVQQQLTILSSEVMTHATISILSSNGRMMLRSSNRSGRHLNVDVAALPAGSYLAQVVNNGKTTTLKFVKQP